MVRPKLDAKGEPTERYEVVAGGRRLAALKLLAKGKRIAKSTAIPCRVLDGAGVDGSEATLAENVVRMGDAAVRTALHDVANALLTRAWKFSPLKRWTVDVAKRRGIRRAKVAPARKLATVLHRIWVDGTEFVWARIQPRPPPHNAKEAHGSERGKAAQLP